MTEPDDETVGDAPNSLSDRFMIPPYRAGTPARAGGRTRKRAWFALGIKSELGRGGLGRPIRNVPQSGQTTRDATGRAPGGSARPACDYGKKQRGDGDRGER